MFVLRLHRVLHVLHGLQQREEKSQPYRSAPMRGRSTSYCPRSILIKDSSVSDGRVTYYTHEKKTSNGCLSKCLQQLMQAAFLARETVLPEVGFE